MEPPHPTPGSSQLCLPPGVADGFSRRSFQPGVTYSCCAENGRVDLTQLMDKFAHLHHLAAQLRPQRCKERQMWHLASCQDTSFFLKVRCTSLAALSPVLLSVTALLSALRMPFSNVGEEELGDTGGKQPFLQEQPKMETCTFHLTLLLRAALSPSRQFLIEVFFHQTGQIQLPGLTSRGSRCHHPDINHRHNTETSSFTSGVIFIVSSITLHSSLLRQPLPPSISWSCGARGQN